MHSNTSGRLGRVLLLGRRSTLLAESLELVLCNAGIPAAVVDSVEAAHRFDDVVALLVCDDDGALLLTSILSGIGREVTVIALDETTVADADVRIPLAADRDDLLRSLGVVGPATVGFPVRRLQKLDSRRVRAGLDGAARLTSRESEVVALLVEGTPSHAIATELNISVHTVRTHVQNILAKLGVHSRLEAAGLAAAQLRVEASASARLS